MINYKAIFIIIIYDLKVPIVERITTYRYIYGRDLNEI